jgi:ABC-type Zn2+ transport system substrate-binding protein/surface adhesin
MYQASVGSGTSGGGDAPTAEAREVPQLRAALKELRAEAVLRADQNRELLAERMKELRQEMKTLRTNPYAIHHSTYMEEGPALIDIEG